MSERLTPAARAALNDREALSLSELYGQAIAGLPEWEQAQKKRIFRLTLRRWTKVVADVVRYGGKPDRDAPPGAVGTGAAGERGGR
jgi:hypothetical protein